MSKDKIINIIFIIGTIFFSIESIILSIKFFNSHQSKYAILTTISIVLTFCFIYLIRQNIEVKKNFSIFFASCIVAAILLEMGLGIFFEGFKNNINLPIKTDKRLPIEVIRDSKKRGEILYGIPKRNIVFASQHIKTLILNGIANSNTLFCKNRDSYITYISDEYGFNNPQGSWQNLNNSDFVFIGDSFTQGVCVKREDHFTDQIRNVYPNLLNLGIMNTGPLVQLATIKEYLPKRVKFVFWGYFEGNDFIDLEREKKEPYLINYLDSNYKQNLMQHQETINDFLIEYLNNKYDEKITRHNKKTKFHFLFNRYIQNPSNLFPNINRIMDHFISHFETYFDHQLYREIITLGKEEVEKRGGKLVMIYFPEYFRYNKQKTPAARQKNEILNLATSLNIDLIDIDEAFSNKPDPLEFFPARKNGHYNETGYKLVAEEIMKFLKNKNFTMNSSPASK